MMLALKGDLPAVDPAQPAAGHQGEMVAAKKALEEMGPSGGLLHLMRTIGKPWAPVALADLLRGSGL
jgi:hypothetical protein